MLHSLFICIWCIYKVYSVCNLNDDYNIDIVIALDGTTGDVDDAMWQDQLDLVDLLVDEMKSTNTRVALTQLGDGLTSLNFQAASVIQGSTATLSRQQIAKRNPYVTVDHAIQTFPAGNFEQQKIVILFTTGEIGTALGNNYCGLNQRVKRDLIQVIVIAVGEAFSPGMPTDPSDGYAQLQWLCVTEDNQNTNPTNNKGFKIRPSFTNLGNIVNELKNDYFCIPDNEYLFVISEIKPEGTGKFVELLNYGRSFTTNNVAITGSIVSGTVNGGGGTIQQGQIVVFGESGITQCSSCLMTSITAAIETVGTWIDDDTFSVTVTIDGTSSISIQHTLNNNEWFRVPVDYTYELYTLGGNEQWSDNWLSSYDTSGTPGGYGPTGNRPINGDEIDASQKCSERALGIANCQFCYSTATGECDCSQARLGVAGFYRPPFDKSVCKKLPDMTGGDSICKIFKRGAPTSTDEEFRFAFTSPNTDMQYKLYIEYPQQAQDYQTLSGQTFQTIDSSNKDPQKGFTSNTPFQQQQSSFVGVIPLYAIDNTWLGTTKFCTQASLNPTKAPTNMPSMTPTARPTDNPTPKPLVGTSWVYIDAESLQAGCGGERCGCALNKFDCDDAKPLVITRSPKTIADDELKPSTINIVDGVGNQDINYNQDLTVTWQLSFLQICRQGELNGTDFTCLNPVITKEELGKRFLPPLGNDSNVNFTFTTDMNISIDIGLDIVDVGMPISDSVIITGTEADRRSPMFLIELILNTLQNEPTLLSGPYYSQFLLEIIGCGPVACSFAYPSKALLQYGVGKDPDGGVREAKDIPTWIWWIIIPLIIFLCIIALLVYKYWWKKRKTDKELEKEENDLNDVIKENELGFANDLDTGNIANNPLAKVNPMMTGPANPGHVDPKQRQNQRIDDVARVKVENFQMRQEYGQTRQQRNIVPTDEYN